MFVFKMVKKDAVDQCFISDEISKYLDGYRFLKLGQQTVLYHTIKMKAFV